MSSNLADLPLDLPADLPPVLTSHGQDWQWADLLADLPPSSDI